MKKVLFIVLVLSLLVSCLPALPPSEEAKTPVSQPVVVENTSVQQQVLFTCWDNSTASDEASCPAKQTNVVLEPPVKDVQPGRQFLNDARSKFKGHAYLLSDRMVIVYQNKSRHYFSDIELVENRQPITDIYFDLENQTAVGYCSLDRESDMEDGDFEFERSECKSFIDVAVPLDFKKVQVKGPLDYLEQYADRLPTRVEDNIQTISIGGNSKSIQPSLHYDDAGKSVILRLDKRYHVPLKIEYGDGSSVDFRETYVDVMVLDGKQEKITAAWVTYQNVSDFWKKEGSK